MQALIHPQSLHLFSRLKPHCKHIVSNSIVLHVPPPPCHWRRSLGKWAWPDASAVTSSGAVQIAVVLKRPLSSALSPPAARSSLARSIRPSDALETLDFTVENAANVRSSLRESKENGKAPKRTVNGPCGAQSPCGSDLPEVSQLLPLCDVSQSGGDGYLSPLRGYRASETTNLFPL